MKPAPALTRLLKEAMQNRVISKREAAMILEVVRRHPEAAEVEMPSYLYGAMTRINLWETPTHPTIN